MSAIHPRGVLITPPSLLGTLVVFRSTTVPHEVLPTTARRTAIVGWLGRELLDDTLAEDRTEETAVGGDSELKQALLRHFREKGETIAF